MSIPTPSQYGGQFIGEETTAYQDGSGNPVPVTATRGLPATPVAPPLTAETVTITNGTALSAAVDLAGQGIVRLVMPAVWTAAALTMQVSTDNVTFSDLYDATGVEWSATVAAGHAVIMDISAFSAVRYVKLRSGTGATPVNQGADRVLTLVTRPY